VLVIDDDEKLVALVRDYLAPHGFEVGAAHDGATGLAAATRGEADVIVLDVMLPGIDGLEVCRRVRGASDVPILMLTARGEETDRIVGLELGADDYLAKPFNPRELLARLRAILRRTGGRAGSGDASRLEVGPLVLDPATRQVLLRGREVELTTAEFDLLHVLLASAGRVLSRDQLMEQLHGASWSYFDRSIDVLVSRLRQKLEDDPRHPALLKTVRGVGYQLARASDGPREGGR
jgi:DNA-binding response OmpR family regulator